ncbi:MAG: hypothetical protein M3252_06685 [Actinomycetota bacterium]|nr:hypothetical protein [Actinomycetota bacterium]
MEEVVVYAAAVAVAALFSVTLVRRYFVRGRTNRALLYWAAALGMFCLATGALAYGATAGWSSGSFRFYYLFGGVLTVPWLALGTVETTARDPGALRVLGATSFGVAAMLAAPLIFAGGNALLYGPGVVLALLWGLLLLTTAGDAAEAASLALMVTFSVVSAFAVASAGLEQPLVPRSLPEGSEVFPAGVRGLALAGNALGTFLVIVGAAVAAFRLRGQRMPHLVVGNLLIALGVLVAASGGLLARSGDTASHSIAFAVGVAIMYAGFSRTIRPLTPPGVAELRNTAPNPQSDADRGAPE